MNEAYIEVKDLPNEISNLKAGTIVYLSGTIYTARDAAHKRLVQAINNSEPLPFQMENAVIYYAGPTPTPANLPIGSCGPTTSSRMDSFTPLLLQNGLIGMIGKGDRSKEVYEAIKNKGAVYFTAIGGVGALAAKSIISTKEIAYEDLGCESIKQLECKNFPLVVAIDSEGNSIFNDKQK